MILGPHLIRNFILISRALVKACDGRGLVEVSGVLACLISGGLGKHNETPNFLGEIKMSSSIPAAIEAIISV